MKWEIIIWSELYYVLVKIFESELNSSFGQNKNKLWTE